jgi:hypothetical protein
LLDYLMNLNLYENYLNLDCSHYYYFNYFIIILINYYVNDVINDVNDVNDDEDEMTWLIEWVCLWLIYI